MKRLRVLLVLLAFSLLTSSVIFLNAWGNGFTFRAPVAFGTTEHHLCVAQQYRLTSVDPTYGLNRVQALAVLREAADYWNDAFGCSVLEPAADGDLEIRLRPPDQRPTVTNIGRYLPNRNLIEIYLPEGHFLVELIAHEMGHALGFEHTETGIMIENDFWCSFGLPCPSDDDRAEIRRQYWYIEIPARNENN